MGPCRRSAPTRDRPVGNSFRRATAAWPPPRGVPVWRLGTSDAINPAALTGAGFSFSRVPHGAARADADPRQPRATEAACRRRDAPALRTALTPAALMRAALDL